MNYYGKLRYRAYPPSNFEGVGGGLVVRDSLDGDGDSHRQTNQRAAFAFTDSMRHPVST